MDSITIAERLLKLRGEKPRKEAAKGIGITNSALSNYENGLRIPRDSVKIKIADYYGSSVQQIFYD